MEPRNHPGGFPQISILISKPGPVLVSAEGNWRVWNAGMGVNLCMLRRQLDFPVCHYSICTLYN